MPVFPKGKNLQLSIFLTFLYDKRIWMLLIIRDFNKTHEIKNILRVFLCIKNICTLFFFFLPFFSLTVIGVNKHKIACEVIKYIFCLTWVMRWIMLCFRASRTHCRTSCDFPSILEFVSPQWVILRPSSVSHLSEVIH